MCPSMFAMPTGQEFKVDWTPPTQASCAGELGIAAKCGCAATVSLRFLPLTVHGSNWCPITIYPSSQNCAQHAGEAQRRVRPLTLFLSLATLEVMSGATGLPPSVVTVPTPSSKPGRYRSRTRI